MDVSGGERTLLHIVRDGAEIPSGASRRGDRVLQLEPPAGADAPRWSTAGGGRKPLAADEVIALLFDCDGVVVW